ncbi:MAG: hypothetical protein ABSF77_09990 [Spirochaetia bacterium]
MGFPIDGSLYPDEPPPLALDDLPAKVDYLSRLCAAWDFGLLPDADTLRELCDSQWREAIDRCRFLTSPTYHLLRSWQHLPLLPFYGSIPGFIREDPSLSFV